MRRRFVKLRVSCVATLNTKSICHREASAIKRDRFRDCSDVDLRWSRCVIKQTLRHELWRQANH